MCARTLEFVNVKTKDSNFPNILSFLYLSQRYLMDGTMRKWLQRMFPRLPITSTKVGDTEVLTRENKHAISISDLENFSLLCLMESRWGCRDGWEDETVRDAYKMAIFFLPPPQPTAVQLSFWHTAIHAGASKVFCRCWTLLWTN